MQMKGACLCGAVRYTCASTPIFQFNCHCRDCQRSTGAAFAPVLFFLKEAVVIEGEARYFESTGGSGKKIRRGFCPTCGSQLFGELELMPAHLSIRAGTLDDTRMYQPRAEIYVSQAAPWAHLDTLIPKFQENAPRR